MPSDPDAFLPDTVASSSSSSSSSSSAFVSSSDDGLASARLFASGTTASSPCGWIRARPFRASSSDARRHSSDATPMASPGTGAFVTFRVPFGRPRRRLGGVACADAGSGTGSATRMDTPSPSDALDSGSLVASPSSLSEAPATTVHAREARARTRPPASPPRPVRHHPLSNRTRHLRDARLAPPRARPGRHGARARPRASPVSPRTTPRTPASSAPSPSRSPRLHARRLSAFCG